MNANRLADLTKGKGFSSWEGFKILFAEAFPNFSKLIGMTVEKHQTLLSAEFFGKDVLAQAAKIGVGLKSGSPGLSERGDSIATPSVKGGGQGAERY